MFKIGDILICKRINYGLSFRAGYFPFSLIINRLLKRYPYFIKSEKYFISDKSSSSSTHTNFYILTPLKEKDNVSLENSYLVFEYDMKKIFYGSIKELRKNKLKNLDGKFIKKTT
jgi:hypothetical protein